MLSKLPLSYDIHTNLGTSVIVLRLKYLTQSPMTKFSFSKELSFPKFLAALGNCVLQRTTEVSHQG
jgi:hypothetical protein